MQIIGSKSVVATLALTLVVSAGAARADVVISSFTESTFTVSGPNSPNNPNNAFCSSGGTCDFKGGTGGNAPGSVNSPLLLGTSTSGLPTLAAGSPTIIGQSGGVLQWWSTGTYNNTGGTTTVTAAANNGVAPSFDIASGSKQLFSDTTFFPAGGKGSNDTSSFLTAEFKGVAAVGAGNTLSFTGSVDDNILIYWRPDGSTGAWTLLSITPDPLSNQASFNFTSSALGAGTYDFEVFYADRSSTDASLTLDANVTAAVPEPSTWAMMILGFFGVGFLAYRKKAVVRFA